MNPRPIPQVLIDTLTATAKHRHGPGHHCFKACEMCGTAMWSMSDPGAQDGVTVEWAHFLCSFCEQASYRFPDVFAWVTRVIGFWTAPGVLSPPAPAPEAAASPPADLSMEGG